MGRGGIAQAGNEVVRVAFNRVFVVIRLEEPKESHVSDVAHGKGPGRVVGDRQHILQRCTVKKFDTFATTLSPSL